MDNERKKELKEQYAHRHPDMGIVCWKNAERMWIAKSRDAKADYNSSSFQLRLGSWRNLEMQAAYNAEPESFHWEILRKLEYEDYEENHDEDLELLYLEVLDEYPDAEPMSSAKR